MMSYVLQGFVVADVTWRSMVDAMLGLPAFFLSPSSTTLENGHTHPHTHPHTPQAVLTCPRALQRHHWAFVSHQLF